MKTYNFAFLFLLQYFVASPVTDGQQKSTLNKSGAANLVYKSIDGGLTWQDISDGLPGNLQQDSIQGYGFFANDTGFYLRAGNGVYRSEANFPAIWEKDIFPGKQGSIAPGKTGLFAYDYSGQILQKTKGTNMWLPIYKNAQLHGVRSVFETAGGTVFIGSDNGLFKSTNGGETWKHVHGGGWVIKLAESNGVLLATSQGGIIRSTDGGETWDLVISEGGVGISVEPIKGGFAAITFNTTLNSRRVRTSYDGGKTWQPIDAGLPASLSIASIIQVGDYLFCGHPDGVFRSADKGKTWNLLLPSIDNKVFNLFASGNVIYAIPRAGGC